MYMYTYMYIYIYTYTHTHIHICLNTFIPLSVASERRAGGRDAKARVVPKLR